MSDITVWGRRSSSNVQKVIWALEELAVPYRQVDVGGLFGGLDEPGYRNLNPNGLVPTLEDDGLVIWESHAIVRYVAAEYGAGRLWPEAAGHRAAADQWAEWTATTFQPAWARLFAAVVRTPASDRNPSAITQALNDTIQCFRLLDARLGEAAFLGGDTLSYADIVAGVSLYRWTTMDIERPSLPHVEAWHKRLLARPAFVKAVRVSYADLVGRLKF